MITVRDPYKGKRFTLDHRLRFQSVFVVPKALGTVVAYHMEMHSRSKLHTSQPKCEKERGEGQGPIMSSKGTPPITFVPPDKQRPGYSSSRLRPAHMDFWRHL